MVTYEHEAGQSPILRVCPHCGTQRQFNHLTNAQLGAPRDDKSVQRQGYVYQCIICLSPLFIEARRSANGRYLSEYERSYPGWVPRSPEGLPSDVARCLHEAQLCQSVNAWNATAVMARRAIQECMREQGAPKGTLEKQIDALTARQVITPQLATWAHEVRDIGNDGAHGKKGEVDVSTDESLIPIDVLERDAKDALAFAEALFDHVYVIPEQLRKRRQAIKPPP